MLSLRTLALAMLLAVPLHASAQQVHRCGNRYSDEPCGAGKVVDVSPAVRNLDSAGTAQVFLCVGHSGGRFWSSTHCREKRALVERIEPVPANLPWNQQVEIADQQTRQAYATQRQRSDNRGNPGVGHTSSAATATRESCAYWNAQVAHYDAMARQPHGPAMQGWIAERRKEARDAQFRARC